jgi:uncharacterized protein (TIGR04222 family)
MIEFLHSIPGPQFLLYYSIFAISIIIIGYFFKRAINNIPTDNIPTINSLDPYTVAILKDNLKYGGVLRLINFSLLAKKLIKFNGKGRNAIISAIVVEPNIHLSKIENFIFQYIKSSKNKQVKIADLASDSKVKRFINEFILDSKQTLKDNNLIHEESNSTKLKFIAYFLPFFIFIIGITKTILGISNDKPVLFLILLLIAFCVISVFLLKYQTKTKLGKYYINKSITQNEWLRTKIQQNDNLGNANPTLALALFGIGIIATSSMFSDFRNVYGITANTSGSGCSSSGCSGSSCGGSSCGGGGCGGGGCGGCGGN